MRLFVKTFAVVEHHSMFCFSSFPSLHQSDLSDSRSRTIEMHSLLSSEVDKNRGGKEKKKKGEKTYDRFGAVLKRQNHRIIFYTELID